MQKTKKPFYKKWWFWILVFLFFAVMANLNTKKETEIVSDPEPEEVQEEIAELPKTTEQELEAIVDSVIKKKSAIHIVEREPGRYNINMHYDESSWDETYFVSAAFTAYIKICDQAYQLDNVDVIELYLIIPMLDAKGNETDDVGFTMIMPKETFETYTWSNLAYVEGIFDNVADDCEQLTVHNAIVNKVDIQKVMYKD